ncbi:MAG: hypothetical protein V4614_15175 [Pseudomonadota bacterium]
MTERITWESKASMLQRGKVLMERFCAANSMPIPSVTEAPPENWEFGVCAYYRQNVTTISVKHCANIGFAGMSWSFPGHSVDRTPYGVIAHELGHHSDMLKSTKVGRYYGNFSIEMRERTGHEMPLTSYCPNDAEWFAEMFRLFVTNPDLLRNLRPRTHADMLQHFKPVFVDTWRERLAGAPERTILSIERKLTPKPASKPRARKQAQETLLPLMEAPK